MSGVPNRRIIHLLLTRTVRRTGKVHDPSDEGGTQENQFAGGLAQGSPDFRPLHEAAGKCDARLVGGPAGRLFLCADLHRTRAKPPPRGFGFITNSESSQADAEADSARVDVTRSLVSHSLTVRRQYVSGSGSVRSSSTEAARSARRATTPYM